MLFQVTKMLVVLVLVNYINSDSTGLSCQVYSSFCVSLSISLKSFLFSLSFTFFFPWISVISPWPSEKKAYCTYALKHTHTHTHNTTHKHTHTHTHSHTHNTHTHHTHTHTHTHSVTSCERMCCTCSPLLMLVLVSSAALEILPRIPPALYFPVCRQTSERSPSDHVCDSCCLFSERSAALCSQSCRAVCFVALKGEMVLKSVLKCVFSAHEDVVEVTVYLQPVTQ